MDKKNYILWGIVIFIFLWMGTTLIPERNKEASINKNQSQENRVIQAVQSAKAQIQCGYSKVEYEYITPSEGVEKFIEAHQIISTTNIFGDEDEEKKQKPIEYVLRKAKSSWQVSLTPNNEEKTIRITGYGRDMLNPLKRVTIQCSSGDPQEL